MSGERLQIESLAQIKSVFLRKSGCSYTVRVPKFWVENESMELGTEFETFVAKGGILVLRPISKEEKVVGI